MLVSPRLSVSKISICSLSYRCLTGLLLFESSPTLQSALAPKTCSSVRHVVADDLQSWCSACPVMCPHDTPWSFSDLIAHLQSLLTRAHIWLLIICLMTSDCRAKRHEVMYFQTLWTNFLLSRGFNVSVGVFSVGVGCFWLCLTFNSVLESPSRLDEEHRLIARYAARLAAEAGNSTVSVPPNPTQDFSWVMNLILVNKVSFRCFCFVCVHFVVLLVKRTR